MKEELSIDQILNSIKQVINNKNNLDNQEFYNHELASEKIDTVDLQDETKEFEDIEVYELTNCISEASCDKGDIDNTKYNAKISELDAQDKINARILKELIDIKTKLNGNTSDYFLKDISNVSTYLSRWLDDNLPNIINQIVDPLVKKEVEKQLKNK